MAGTPNFLAKYVNNDDVGSSGVLEAADGAIGLGTIAHHSTRIHVRYNNNTGDFTGLAVGTREVAATPPYSGMLFYDHTNALTPFPGYNNSTHEYRINNIAKSGGEFDGWNQFHDRQHVTPLRRQQRQRRHRDNYSRSSFGHFD